MRRVIKADGVGALGAGFAFGALGGLELPGGLF